MFTTFDKLCKYGAPKKTLTNYKFILEQHINHSFSDEVRPAFRKFSSKSITRIQTASQRQYPQLMKFNYNHTHTSKTLTSHDIWRRVSPTMCTNAIWPDPRYYKYYHRPEPLIFPWRRQETSLGHCFSMHDDDDD